MSGGLYPKFKRVQKEHQKNKTTWFHTVRWLWCWKQGIEKMERTLRRKSAWNKKCLRASHKNNCVETGQIRCAPLACTLTNCCTILPLKQMRIRKLHIPVKKMISNTPKLLVRGSTIDFLLSSLLKDEPNRELGKLPNVVGLLVPVFKIKRSKLASYIGTSGCFTRLEKLVKEKRFVFYLCGTIQIKKTFLIKCLPYYWIIASKSQLNCAWV